MHDDVPASLASPNRRWWHSTAARLLALATALAAVKFVSFWFDDLSRAHEGTFATRLLEEATGAYAAIPFLLLFLWVARRVPIERARWKRVVVVHAATFVVGSLLHTSLMAVLRWMLFPAFGLGSYDYGRFPERFVMEGANDAIFFAFILVIHTLWRHREQERRRALRAAELEAALAQAQLRALHQRLEPHFLFNALNTVSAVMYEDRDRADDVLTSLAELLRVSLRAGDRQEVTLGEELETLALYGAITEARFGARVRLAVHVPDALHAAAVPALLLQPLVENAVRHGNAERLGHGRIDVRARRDGERLVLEVEDDGPGEPAKDATRGIGLGGTIERLRLLHGDLARVTTANLPDGGFRVTLALPWRTATPARADDAMRPAAAILR
jgi:two-component system LytT family sensor kinase